MATITTQRVFNFSAGPATIPVEVLEQMQAEMLSLPGLGASVMEISHRGKEFSAILADAKARLRDLLSLSDEYEILFLQGGGRLLFSMIPLNFADKTKPADYIVTGSWGDKAYGEAVKEGAVNLAWSGKSTKYDRLPTADEIKYSDDPAYVYYCSNETIQGVQFASEPESKGAPLICDASSDFMCRPLPMEKYGLIYACAQKNLGPAGVTVVVAKKELLAEKHPELPGYLDFSNHLEGDSCYNTPNTFGIYVIGLIAKWLQESIGGLEAMHEQNRKKADMLYSVIDEHPEFFIGHAQPNCRSIMNVTFRLPSEELTSEFLTNAAAHQLVALKGHRSVGGVRASIYNAMPVEGVETLRDYMKDFVAKNG